MKKKPKITWASSVAVDALEPYVREILQVMADVTEQPGVAGAAISDESWLSDFLPLSACGDHRDERKAKFQAKVDQETDPERKAAYERLVRQVENGPSLEEVEAKVRAAFSELGIEVDSLGVPVYEVAIKLRDA